MLHGSESPNSWSKRGERKCNRSDDVESKDKFGRFVCRRSHHASRDSSRARKRPSSRQMCRDRSSSERRPIFILSRIWLREAKSINFSLLGLCGRALPRSHATPQQVFDVALLYRVVEACIHIADSSASSCTSSCVFSCSA